MAQTTISIRMDEELKRNFDHICDELGMSMTTAITMMAKKMIREKRLPFEACIDPFYSESNLEHLRRGVAELNAGKGIRKTMAELEAMERE